MKEIGDRIAFWRGHWQAWSESGLSQRAYCGQAGLSYAAFGYWRQRVQAVPAAPAPAFVPVVVEPPEAVVPMSPAEETGIEVRLAHGRAIRVGPAFDAAVLARVIRVLEQTPC